MGQNRQEGKQGRIVGLRLKAIVVVVPVLIATVIISNNVSSVASARTMTGMATRLLNYKAEELKRYAANQWELLVSSDLAERQVYVETAQRAVSSYAATMIRTTSELIFAVDSQANVTMATSEISMSTEEQARLREMLSRETREWVELDLEQTLRVGHSFYFSPFDWYVFVTETEDAFYGEIRSITLTHAIVLAVALALAVLLIILFSGYLTGPIQRIVAAMRRIINTQDFSSQVQVEYNDEIGQLASEFNIMVRSLDRAYRKLRDFADREARARREVTAREYETLHVLGRATDYKDPETGAHIERVGRLSEMLAELLGQSEEERDLIRYAAPLHDIGKLGVPDSILLKSGKLSKQETERMQMHTNIAFEILKDSESKYLRAGAVIALSHHERFDGSGYPHGRAGEDIPLVGRIVGLVDVFDSLITKRSYKRAWSMKQALEHIEAQRGKHFDPRIVDLFLANLERVKEILKEHED